MEKINQTEFVNKWQNVTDHVIDNAVKVNGMWTMSSKSKEVCKEFFSWLCQADDSSIPVDVVDTCVKYLEILLSNPDMCNYFISKCRSGK